MRVLGEPRIDTAHVEAMLAGEGADLISVRGRRWGRGRGRGRVGVRDRVRVSDRVGVRDRVWVWG